MQSELVETFYNIVTRLENQGLLSVVRCDNCHSLVSIIILDSVEPAVDTIICTPCYTGEDQ